MAEGKRLITKSQTATKFPPNDCLEEKMILQFVCKVLLEEIFPKNCSIYVRTNGNLKTFRESLYKINVKISESVINGEILWKVM
jgi:hypothetical protein